MPEKVAVLWVHFGPYHLARLRALRQQCEVAAIQFAAGQPMYGWRSDESDEVVTVRQASHGSSSGLLDGARLWRILNERNPQMLFIPGYREPLALVAAAWGKMHGRTNVLMFDSTAGDLKRSTAQETLKGWLVRVLFDKAFVSGSRSRAYLASLAGGMACEQGYDVVDNAYFSSRAEQWRAEGAQARLDAPFLFVGRLAEEKNLSLLLEAFKGYRRLGGRRTLELIGHGPLEDRLKAEVAEAGLGELVHFRGHQSYEDLPRWYAHAACLILPSTSEPWGLVVNEAMASGLPVMVSDCCGCADDLVDESGNGFRFSATSAESLSNCMVAFDRLTDAALAEMGRRSQQRIARYSTTTWTEAVLRLAEDRSRGFSVA